MPAHPVETIGGLTTTANVPKADFVSFAKARIPIVMADADEVRNTLLAGQLVIYIKALEHDFVLDTSDSVTSDNGTTCIISSDGKRFKRVPTPPPVTVAPLPSADFKGLIVEKVGINLYVRDRWSDTLDRVQAFTNDSTESPTLAGLVAKATTIKLILASELPEDTATAFLTAPVETLVVAGDDSPPVWLNGSVLGGGHGFDAFTIVKAAHGKTNVDVGSRWTDGAAKVWVIAGIRDVNTLLICEMPGGTATLWTISATLPTGTTLTHQSGATHTGAISSFTSLTAASLLPFIQRQTLRITLDGIAEITADGVYAGDRLDLSQSYGIPNVRSVMDDLIANVGSASDPIYNKTGIQTQIEVGITYSFRPGEMMTVAYDNFVVQQTSIDQIAGMQAAPQYLAGSDKLFLFIPRSITETSTGSDFSTPVDITALGGFGYELNTAEWVDANDPPERFITIKKDVSNNPLRGFLMGYSHLVGVGVPATRATSINKAIIFMPKLYPCAVAGVTASAGAHYSTLGYRGHFDASADTNVTSQGVYSWGGKKYWVFDTKAALTNVWVKPPYGARAVLTGSSISVTGNGKKSASLTMSSLFISDRGVLMSTTAGGGWFIAEIANG